MCSSDLVTSGTIHLDGEPITGPRFRETRRKIGYLPENVVLYDNLTGLETLHFFADLKAVPRADCPALLDTVGLAHAAGRRVREYSKGMRQRLGFAQALLGTPRLLFLDEPTTGLDADSVERLVEAVAAERARGVIQILVTHDGAFAARVADTRIGLRAGRRLDELATVPERRPIGAVR